MGGLGLFTPARARFDVNAMTATVTQSPTPTAFDWAMFAAVAAGWPGEAAFTACVVMRAAGLTDCEIEKAFLDCRKRVQ
jgi:hypothetical protein